MHRLGAAFSRLSSPLDPDSATLGLPAGLPFCFHAARRGSASSLTPCLLPFPPALPEALVPFTRGKRELPGPTVSAMPAAPQETGCGVRHDSAGRGHLALVESRTIGSHLAPTAGITVALEYGRGIACVGQVGGGVVVATSDSWATSWYSLMRSTEVNAFSRSAKSRLRRDRSLTGVGGGCEGWVGLGSPVGRKVGCAPNPCGG